MHTLRLHGISPCSRACQSAKLTAVFIAGWWRMMLPRCNILLMTTRSWSETMLNYRGSLIFTFRNGGWSVSPPTSRSVLASGFPVLFRSACCRFWRSNLPSAAEIKRRIETGQISGVTVKMLKSRKLKNAKYDLQLSVETLYDRRRIVLTRR